MPSKRIAVWIAAAVVAVGAMAVAAFVLVRDEEATPSGDLIAYGCREPKNVWYAVCVIRQDGTDRKRLTTRLPATGSAWSPDGRRIAFTRHQEVGESTAFTDDDVFVMDADGDGVLQLTKERPGFHSGQPTWSPDGREIAFVRGPALAAGIGQPGSLFVMATDGSDVRRLTRGALDSGPAWSPDGSEIVFSRAKDFNSPRGIWVVDVTGGEPRELTHTADYFDTFPAWSPDGTRIAFARAIPQQSEFDGKSAIYAMNRDGTGLELILRHQHFARAPLGLAWSPDGRTIAFETSPTIECTAISLVEVESGAVRPLTSCTRLSESAVSPAWQPATSASGG